MLSVSLVDYAHYGLSARPNDVIVADLNGDGRPDIASANSAGQSINVRYSNANGTFSSSTIWPTTGFGPERIAAGDVDGDLDIDLIASDVDGKYQVFKNGPGSGGFRNFNDLTVVDTGTSIFVDELVDLDGDGHLDFVTGAVGLHVYKGQNNGTFAASPTDIAVPSGDVVDLQIADLDGVGVPDMIVGVAGTSSATIRPHEVRIIPNFDQTGTNTTVIDSVPVLPTSIAMGDFNKDSKLDFVVGGSVGGSTPAQVLRFHANDGLGGFVAGNIVFNFASSPRSIKAADIDGDGNLDIVAITSSYTLEVVQGNGDGTFKSTSTSYSPGNAPAEFVLADFSSDSKTDVVIVNTLDDEMAVFLNNSTPGGDPTPTSSLTAGFDKITLPSVFVPGDKGTAQVVITNTGDKAKGKVTIALYASSDTTLDDGDVLLDTGKTLTDKSVSIATNKTAKLTGKFVAPATLANGAYYLIAKVTPAGITGATEFTGSSITTLEKATSFGTVGARKNIKYSYNDSDGTLVTLSLSGPGTGVPSESL